MKSREIVYRFGKQVLLLSAISGILPVAASEWYVDASAAAGGNGSSEAPYRTIQDAIDASSTVHGDTILVRPGCYTVGGKSYGKGVDVNYLQPCRVYIDKRIHLKSTGGKEITHIVGAPGLGASEVNGSGGATLCILAGATAAADQEAVTIEGFTLRDGTACKNSGGAGGICSGGTGYTTNRYTMVDCVISNCIGQIGAMQAGVGIRCHISNCYGYDQGTVKNTSLYNCLLDGQKRSCFVTKNCGPIVNCTIVNNVANSRPTYTDAGNVAADGGGHFYNCVIFGNSGAFNDANGVYHNCYVDGSSYSAASENVTTITRDNSHPFTDLYLSPILGDWRLVDGGTIAAHGDSSLYPAIFPAQYQMTGFDGGTMFSASTLPAGVLMPSVAPATAALAQTEGQRLKFNGVEPASSGHVHYSDVWPAQVYVEPVESEKATLMAVSFQVYGSAANTHGWFSGGRGVWVTIPPVNPTLGPVKLYAQGSSKRLYVDCNLGDYTGHDGTTWEKAYKTIQEALDAASGSPAWIRVKGGVYDEGTGSYDGIGSARVCVNADNKATLVEGVDGAANTEIVGSDSLRCMILSGTKVCVAGFTLRDGHGSNYGGGVYARNADYITVQDCRITGCTSGSNSSATYGGTFLRCVFDNNMTASGVSRGGYSVACIYRNNPVTASSGACSMYSSHKGYNCTVYNPNDGQHTIVNSDTVLINTLIAAGGNMSASTAILAGNMASPYGLLSHAEFTETQFVYADPLLASPATGDFRPAATSPVFGAGVISASGIAPEVLCHFVTCDFDNNPIVAADGSIPSGAFAVGREPVTYYVDAAKPDDSGDGLAESTAKGTLAGAMSLNPLPGDEVVALPGVYSAGSMLHTFRAKGNGASTPSIRSRVVVPGGVVLRSRDGAETTVIEGASATQGADDYGRGSDAVRGAAVCAGGTLRGFTVRGGRTAAADNAYTDDLTGGGVLGEDYLNAFVEDCFLTNNVSSCAGGAGHIVCRRCRVVGNVGVRYASAARYASLYNCYFAGNRGDRVTEVLFDCINCTYGDNEKLDGSASVIFENMGSCECLANVVVCGKVRTGVSNADRSSLGAKTLYNCVFPSEMRIYNTPAAAEGLDMTHTLDQLRGMFSDGYPVDRNVLTVDAGRVVAAAGDRDVLGRDRVSNGAIDIGAFEYDWLGDYGAALGSHVTVTAAEGVVEANEVLALSGGGELTTAWQMPAGRSSLNYPCSIAATLDGVGVLDVYLNGVKIGSLSESGEVRFRNASAQNDIVLKYTGTGTASLEKFRRDIGMAISFR